jgi:hypothetical protein
MPASAAAACGERAWTGNPDAIAHAASTIAAPAVSLPLASIVASVPGVSAKTYP